MKNNQIEESPMSDEQDAFLTSLLKYHSAPVDDNFVSDILTRISAKESQRTKLLAVAMLIAFVLSMPLLITTVSAINLASEPFWYVTALLFAMLAITTWISSEHF
ncbi:hypothetical protein [Thalassotalea sp. G2M2-11]|uniref:hypothetical protein n=1 Tax=Thalassotalea sp. G2M2-11 TaxID=2787627 RepID=UPI0019CF9EC1|nr:hypothetical protein [Thalassotalea sp. G2M2-11]